jgi:HSP20 family molecular chaperone IbpA
MILRYRSRIVKQDATSQHPHQWSDPSNQGKCPAYSQYQSESFTLPSSNTEYRLDLHEDTEKNVVTATFEFPGFSKDEVQINFQNGKLTVSAETKKSQHNADTGYTLSERLHGKFSRTLQLPQGVQVCRSFLNLLE